MRLSFRVLATALGCTLLAGCLHFGPGRLAPGVTREVSGDWALTARTDPFTRQSVCRLTNHLGRRPNVTFTREAFAFHFGRSIDTANAWLRIDNGPPQPWSDVVPHLIDTGSMSEAERLDNPSRGVVLIPREMVSGVHIVVIRPARKAWPKLFDMDGASGLLAKGASMNCRFG